MKNQLIKIGVLAMIIATPFTQNAMNVYEDICLYEVNNSFQTNSPYCDLGTNIEVKKLAYDVIQLNHTLKSPELATVVGYEWKIDGEIVSKETTLKHKIGYGSHNISFTVFAISNDGTCCEEIILKSVEVNKEPNSNMKLKTSNTIKLYPNPSSNIVYLYIENIGENSNLKITNEIGKLVMNTNINKNETSINISNFARGTYFLSITVEDKVYSEKIIKI